MDADELEARISAAVAQMAEIHAEMARDVLRWVVAKVDECAPHVAFVAYVTNWDVAGVTVMGLYEADGAEAAHTYGLDELHDALVGDEVLGRIDRAPFQIVKEFSVRPGPGEPRRLDVAKIRAELCS